VHPSARSPPPKGVAVPYAENLERRILDTVQAAAGRASPGIPSKRGVADSLSSAFVSEPGVPARLIQGLMRYQTWLHERRSSGAAGL